MRKGTNHPNHKLDAPPAPKTESPIADDVVDSSFASDVSWVFARLDDRRATVEDAPGLGAWNLLEWAREERDRFFEQVLPKALTIKAMSEVPAVANECSEDAELWGPMDLELALDRMWTQDLPPGLLEDVTALIDAWARCHGLELSDECRDRLSWKLGAVSWRCMEAVARDPKTFRGFLATV